MILGLPIETFIKLHVIISLVAIGAGLFAMISLARRLWRPGWQALFLATTFLTSATGFFFPFSGITPAFAFGVISILALAVALFALAKWDASSFARVSYAIAATFALYLNLAVLVVQSFQKIDALQSLAPTQTELPFILAQVAVMAVALVMARLAAKATPR